jgi:acyl carrier protein
MEDTKQVIIDVLVEESVIEQGCPEKDFELDLLRLSAIDSLSIVDLITALEEKLDIEFDPEDIVSANWYSVNAIIDTVTKKLTAQKKAHEV